MSSRQRADDEILARFSKVRAWEQGGVRAPHKPLLLLLVLARIQRGEGAALRFSEVEGRLRELLRRFGPKRKSLHPEYPFWHLQSDGLWSLEGKERMSRIRKGSTNPPLSELRRVDPTGRLDPALADRLVGQPALVNRIAAQLLENGWERSYHEDILDAVGFPWVPEVDRLPRDPGFRDAVLRIYEHRCAVCGFDGRLGEASLAIEAAHLRWHSAAGPDTLDNGIALCVLHHVALDRGAIGLEADGAVLVSQDAHGGDVVNDLLVRLAGKRLRSPMPGQPAPAAAHAAWHRREVFRMPARQPA